VLNVKHAHLPFSLSPSLLRFHCRLTRTLNFLSLTITLAFPLQADARDASAPFVSSSVVAARIKAAHTGDPRLTFIGALALDATLTYDGNTA
jgi:hypothetical protein